MIHHTIKKVKVITCPACDGAGELYDSDEEESETCDLCDGTGELPQKEKVVIKKDFNNI